jgi:hypothetical protein
MTIAPLLVLAMVATAPSNAPATPDQNGTSSSARESTVQPEALRVAIALEELAGICSGRNEFSYIVDGHTGRWQLSVVNGPQWGAAVEPSSESNRHAQGVGVVLKSVADVDSSGSVSMAEASTLYGLIAFGYIQAHFRAPNGYNIGGLIAATGLSAVELSDRQSQLQQLVVRATTGGLPLPWAPGAK